MHNLLFGTLVALVPGCTTVFHSDIDKKHTSALENLDVMISIADQKLHVLEDGKIARSYRISSGINGVGEDIDSGKTPRGRHRISQKLGYGAPDGLVFDSLIATDQIADATWTGKPPVTTRILLLEGREQRNLNTHQRMIYIHGSPVEKLLGQPASGGCIRLSVSDIKELFELVSVGSNVDIFEESTNSAFEIRLERSNKYQALRERATGGDHRAVHQLCFGHRYGTKQIGLDYGLALRWCQIGADHGDPASMTLLAEILFEGLDVSLDRESGILWYLRAAVLGHPFARKRVIGILQDPIFAEVVDGQADLLLKLKNAESESLKNR